MSAPDLPGPSPDLDPGAVVAHQLAALVHTAPLSDLLCFATAQHGLLRADGDHAEQEVVLARPTGATSAYTFLLTRQRSGPLTGCWMTDAMLRI